MKHIPWKRAVAAACAAATLLSMPLAAQAQEPAAANADATASGRLMENLGRGVVAVRRTDAEALITWRLLSLDPQGIAFNVYRTPAGGQRTLLNEQPLTGGTNLVDATADFSVDNTYEVLPVVDGKELAEQYGRATSGNGANSFTLKANAAEEPVVRIPIAASNDPVAYMWPGDLDGDGEYDYVLDRQPKDTSTPAGSQKLEAYRRDGTLLWRVDLGPNSLDPDSNRFESGSSAIDQGSSDGATVYDFDSDGKAELAVRIGNGVVFGDGTTFNELPDDMHQAIALVDGEKGTLKTWAPVPTTYLADGTLFPRLGVGYLDGRTPSLIAALKNRQDGKKGPNTGPFNLMYTAWHVDNGQLTMQWEWDADGDLWDDAHNIRIVDVDGDGRDESCSILFCLNPDGSLRQSFAASDGTHHGDRFYITDLVPDRAGLEGYAVQQLNPNGMKEYVYDPAYVGGAEPGATLWRFPEQDTSGDIEDVGRGMVGDIDPSSPGAEVWSSSTGLKSAATGELLAARQPGVSNAIYPDMGVMWDGDLGKELLNNMTINEWVPASQKLSRLTSASGAKLNAKSFGAVGSRGGLEPTGVRNFRPTFYGDLFGDWREEVAYTNADFDELIIFTTDQPTDARLYSLAQNPAYRNDMTVKGYMQDHEVDYYIGFDMAKDANGQPAVAAPNVQYIGAQSGDPDPTPDPDPSPDPDPTDPNQPTDPSPEPGETDRDDATQKPTVPDADADTNADADARPGDGQGGQPDAIAAVDGANDDANDNANNAASDATLARTGSSVGLLAILAAVVAIVGIAFVALCSNRSKAQ